VTSQEPAGELTADQKISVAIRSLTDFYAPRMLWLMDATAFLLDEARPRVVAADDPVRLDRLTRLDSRLKGLNEDLQLRTEAFLRESMER
jgi:hypothetical protein